MINDKMIIIKTIRSRLLVLMVAGEEGIVGTAAPWAVLLTAEDAETQIILLAHWGN
jgi:hypothetical protein